MPLKSGTRCTRPCCPGSKHCEAHREKALKSYKRYKALHEFAKTYDHESVITSTNWRGMMKYYSILHKVYTGRARHSEEFFVEEERDEGHKGQISVIRTKLIEVEIALSLLIHPKVCNNTDTESEDEDLSDSSSSFENVEETVQENVVPEDVPPRAEDMEIFIVFNGILDTLDRRISVKHEDIEGMRLLYELLVFATIKADTLGLFEHTNQSLYEHLDNPDHLVILERRPLTFSELKIVYKRILLNWKDVECLYMSLYTICATVGSSAVAMMPFKLCKIGPKQSLHLAIYFPPRVCYMKLLRAICERVNNGPPGTPGMFYIMAVIPKLFLDARAVRNASTKITFLCRLGTNKWMVRYNKRADLAISL